MKTRLKLNVDELAENFFESARLLGLVVPVKPYQFCWWLNHLLGFDFRINNEIEIQLIKKQRQYYFTIFEYHEPNCALTHYLYCNTFDGEVLLPEYKHLDFLWLMRGDEISGEYLDRLQQALKNISGVQMVMEIHIEKIKHRGHLIF